MQWMADKWNEIEWMSEIEYNRSKIEYESKIVYNMNEIRYTWRGQSIELGELWYWVYWLRMMFRVVDRCIEKECDLSAD